MERKDDFLASLTPGPSPDGRGEERAAKWLARIEAASKGEKKWRDRARRVVDRYRDEDKREGVRYNILFANTQTMFPALYSRLPRPDVRRRAGAEKREYRDISALMERALTFAMDKGGMNEAVSAAVFDMILVGRGVARVRFSETVTESGWPDVQDVTVEPVFWGDFRIDPVRRFEDALWIAFRHRMDKDEIAEKFPGFEDRLAYTSMDAASFGEEDEHKPGEESEDCYAILWEVWDKRRRRVIFLAEGFGEALADIEDPMGLYGFFPIAAPLYAIRTTDTLTPIPPYTLYQDLAAELDSVTDRIQSLTGALKLRGLYDASQESLARVLEADDNEMLPVENFITLRGNGGIGAGVEFLPLGDIGSVLSGLYQNREALKAAIYEVTGISDILRGASVASETATAQRIKGQWGAIRLQSMQADVQRFCRDLIEIMAEVIVERMSPIALAEMTSVEVTGDMLAVVRDDTLRNWKIDIETDSTIVADEQAEQEARGKLLAGMVSFVTGIAPMVQGGLFPPEAAIALLKFGIQPYRGSREVMDVLEEMGTGAAANMAAPVVPPGGGMDAQIPL